MFENITKLFKRFSKNNKESKDTAKERLQLVLMQDRANVSADFLELMKQEIIEVIKKYVDVDENLIDVTLTNTFNKDETTGIPALYANIPIISLKDEAKKINVKRKKEEASKKEKEDEKTEAKAKEVKESNNNLEEKNKENKEDKEKNEGKNKEKVEEDV